MSRNYSPNTSRAKKTMTRWGARAEAQYLSISGRIPSGPVPLLAI